MPEAEYADADYEEGEWVANADTGEMEWHAADGSVMTQDQWNAQASGETPAAEATEAEAVDAEPVDAGPAGAEQVPAGAEQVEVSATTRGVGDNAGE